MTKSSGSDSKMPTESIIPLTPPVPMFRTASSTLEIRGFWEANAAELAICSTRAASTGSRFSTSASSEIAPRGELTSAITSATTPGSVRVPTQSSSRASDCSRVRRTVARAGVDGSGGRSCGRIAIGIDRFASGGLPFSGGGADP